MRPPFVGVGFLYAGVSMIWKANYPSHPKVGDAFRPCTTTLTVYVLAARFFIHFVLRHVFTPKALEVATPINWNINMPLGLLFSVYEAQRDRIRAPTCHTSCLE